MPLETMDGRLGNYVRTHRKKAGLTQRELGGVLGYNDEGAVSRHERSRSLPPLLIALGYSIIFRTSVSEIFAGLHETVEQVVESRLRELEETLQQRSGENSQAAVTARKLEWLSERRS
jgi:DNA-binding XRE family transcriptional regulator